MAVVGGRTAADRVLILLGILGSAAIAVAAVVYYEPGSQPPGATGPPATQSTQATSRPTQQPTRQPTRRPSTQPPLPSSVPTVPGAPARPAIRLDTKPRPDGTFDVIETVVFRQPQNWLVLVPALPRTGGDALEAARPRAEQLRVTSEGRPLDVGIAEIDRELDVPLPETVAQVELRYRLTGATVRSTPSADRRALALLAPLSVATDETLRTTVVVRGATVLNLTCPLLPTAQQLCASPTGPQAGVVSDVPAADAVVVAQFNLPPASS